MIRFSRDLKRFILVAGDLAVFELSLLAALWIRSGDFPADAWGTHVVPFSIVIVLWLVVFYVAGLYDLTLTRTPLRLLRTYMEGMVANLGVAVAFFYLIPFFGIAPRTNLFYYFAVSLLLGYTWRLLFNRFLLRRFAQGRVLFVGPAEEVPGLLRLLQSSSLGLELTASIATSGVPDPLLPVRWMEGIHHFDKALTEERVNTVVLGTRPDVLPDLKNALYRSLAARITLLDRAEIEEATTGRIPLSYVSETWFLHHLNEASKTWYETVKRASDVLLAIPFGLATLLAYPFLALGIKWSSPGPALYTQTRVGRHGKPVKIYKFRTMFTDAEKGGPQFTASTVTDPRVTGIGRVLRRLRIDELPQVWNVLRGDLSFVGPRPERPEFVAPLLERMPHYDLRHLTRPGLTGWAQVQFLTPTATLEDNLTKLQYDLYYIKNRSLILDLAILLKTIGIVLRRQGT